MPETIGFVGVGLIGAPMAERVLALGHTLLLVERANAGTRRLMELGAQTRGTPAAIAQEAPIVLACLPDNESCRRVVLGPEGLAAGAAMQVFVNLGTAGAAFSEELDGALSRVGKALVDAPVTGGVQGARKGALTVMASGPRSALERVRPVLEAFGSTIAFVGERTGSAQTLKLINNLLSATAFAVTAEAYVMALKAGLDPKQTLEVINAGSGRNTASADKFPRAILTRTFEVGATTNTILKDLKLCLAEAEALGIPTWVGPSVRQSFLFSAAQGTGEQDLSLLVKHLEIAAGLGREPARRTGSR
jgi:3-hydroxyisobutyrate dehydrogenase-like beta-hydroxyacid dehydrogenase